MLDYRNWPFPPSHVEAFNLACAEVGASTDDQIRMARAAAEAGQSVAEFIPALNPVFWSDEDG